MRIVHTSDWHVGRRWKGIQRLDELEAVLDHLAGFIERESIDLVLHTGDVFESRNPPAEAEQLVNRFLVRMGRTGARMIVVAGNHDDPLRLDARSLLTEFVNAQIFGRPRSAARGGTQMIEIRGEKAVIAALPFASPGAWVSALDLAGDEAAARSKYARMFELAVQDLCAPFRRDAVNLLLAHTHLEGALFGDSERRVHIGEDWAASPEALPSRASYIALGHLHKPQEVDAARAPAFYAGSILQMDFGEAGEEKSFNVVTVSPGQRATVERIPYEGGLPLIDLRASLAELEEIADQYRRGWLRVTVPLTERDPDLNRKVRELLPNALVVRADLPESEEPPEIRLETGIPPVGHYAAFHLREHEQAADIAVLDAFQDLYDQVSGED